MDITSQINNWAKIINESDDIGESEKFDKARRIGYLGDDNEQKIADWLKSDYAKWKQRALDVFTRVSDGDEEKGQELFDEYNRLSKIDGFASAWSSDDNKYLKPQEFLDRFSKKVPTDDTEVKELLDKL